MGKEDELITLLNKYLDDPLYAQYIFMDGMPDLFAIYQKRRWWFSKEVAEISTGKGTTDFKVKIKEKDKRWSEQIKTAAKKVTRSSPFQLEVFTVHD